MAPWDRAADEATPLVVPIDEAAWSADPGKQFRAPGGSDYRVQLAQTVNGRPCQA